MRRRTTQNARALSCGFGLLMAVVVGWTAPSALAAAAGEDCDDANLIAGGTFMDSDTTTGRNADYDLDGDAANGDCGSGQTVTQETGLGPDAVYKLNTPDDCAVTVTATPIVAAWNLSLYLLSGSCNPGGFSNVTCLALDDDLGDGEAETVVFAAEAGVTYFIIVDGVNGSSGDFDFELDCCPDDDGDLVCNAVDVCDGDDASGDTDGDGICDDRDVCDGDDATGDTDGDGVCDDTDVCDGNDSSGDSDGDGVCDDSDPCPADNPNDSDGDGVCDSTDICPGGDDNADDDGDGVPDFCEEDPEPQPTPDINACGCGSGIEALMVASMTFMGIGWMRRRTFPVKSAR